MEKTSRRTDSRLSFRTRNKEKNMGGSLNMVYRDENGNTEFREIYTGGMYTIQMSPDVIEKKNIIPLLDEWYGRDEVFDSNKIHPSGYGLFVVDYLKNEMYSIQGYCGTGDCYASLDGYNIRAGENDTILQHIKNNRVKSVGYFVMGKGDEKGHFEKVKSTKKSPITVDSIKSLIKTQNATFTFDMSPIKVIEFKESKAGYRKLKKHMLGNGFGIDEDAWNEFVKDTFDN
jgi:hypothetical protein